VEEIVDTSYSDYDDAPEKDHESSEENEDELEDEPHDSPYRPPRGLRLSERDLIQFNQPLPEHWTMLGGNELA
jgi:hypothetical protein